VKESRRLNGSNCEQALPIVKAFGAREVYIYAMGMEPWYEYFMGLAYQEDSKQLCEARSFIAACGRMNVDARLLFGSHSVSYPVGT